MRERLAKLLREVLGPAVSLPEPLPVDRRLSDLGVSSVNMLALMMAVETAFDIEIPPGEITPENFHSVTSIQAMIERLRLQSPAA